MVLTKEERQGVIKNIDPICSALRNQGFTTVSLRFLFTEDTICVYDISPDLVSEPIRVHVAKDGVVEVTECRLRLALVNFVTAVIEERYDGAPDRYHGVVTLDCLAEHVVFYDAIDNDPSVSEDDGVHHPPA